MATKTKTPEELAEEQAEYDALTPAQKRVHQRPKPIPTNSTFGERKAKRVGDAPNKRVGSAKTK